MTLVVLAAAVTLSRLDRPDREADVTSPSAVKVAATSKYQFDSLIEMAAASDAVVRATVVTTERGRLVGDPGAGGIVTRVVTLKVDESFDSEMDGLGEGATLLVEEEGWLPTGEELIVDDLQPSAPGDAGVWFLQALDETEAPTFIVINSQGRFLNVDGHVVGGRADDPLVDATEAASYSELVDALRQLTRQQPESQPVAP
jgi:hypothetical protein